MKEETNMPKVLITDTILRDAHQSQAATRMRVEDMLPACDTLDKIGYYSLECWGGATFDTCLRFLNEDPWERLRKLRKALRRQLGYVGRDLRIAEDLAARLPPDATPLCERDKELLETIAEVWRQQKYMLDNRTHSVPERIVSLRLMFT